MLIVSKDTPLAAAKRGVWILGKLYNAANYGRKSNITLGVRLVQQVGITYQPSIPRELARNKEAFENEHS